MARKAKTKPDTLQTSLEKKFPSVDSNLIASLLSDIDPGQQSQLDDLHATLAALSSPPDDMQSLSLALEISSLTSSGSLSDPLNDSASSQVATSTSSTSSLASFSTPLGFLQNLFPRLPSSTLQSNLEEYGADNLDQIVECLLSDDYIRELRESDIGPWDDSPPSSDPVAGWAAVARKSPKSQTPILRQKTKKKQAAMVLGDVRHRHLAPSRAATGDQFTPSIDPWNYVDSLATQLNAILPNVSTTIFSSAFHNPIHPTPAAALRATLASLGHTQTVDDFALAALLALLDGNQDDIPDANLCLRATASEPNDAYHLFEILRETDERFPVIIHSHAPLPTSPILSVNTTRAPTGPPDTPPIPQIKRPFSGPSSPVAPVPPTTSAWGTVPTKSKARATTYPYVSVIPGSSGWGNSGRVTDEEHNSINEDNPSACLEEAAYWQEKRRTALRQASELYTRQKHEHGREGALYYSQRAQDCAAKEKEWRMKAAKAGVKARQEQSPHRALDLHGLTVNQSLEIVREGVNTWWNSAGSGATPSTPLQIITGQGRHSKGNIPVIAPAVLKLLEREGWRAHKREGTVYVTGVTTKR
ncbi:Smr domain protein [Ceratobasidium sp. AG-Ba]|nr:Smr domain protein [Ceratobasidium sp. AG-Ba]